ncbi:MAG: BMP family ABC transporter substrate-binding protein [bacterium]|jgi:basic membrane protein A|nr:BMP family ABC transporter substrate-binding protein [Betaproteobacteria bacterium]
MSAAVVGGVRVPVFLFGWPGRGSFNASAAGAVDRLKAPLAARGFEIAAQWLQAFDAPSRIEAISSVLSAGGTGLAIVHGGQGDEPVARLAPLHPSLQFAVTQGAVTGSNVASYEVRQEDSAFLAGVLAARTTRTGKVAHLSGERVRPGLLGRAAFVAGVQAEAPGMPVLTAFCGHQHDPALARHWASAMFDAGADVLFTMLDGGRPGAVDACQERGTALIGNVEDWTLREPEVCIASAIADSGWGVERAVEDWLAGRFPAGSHVRVGVSNPAVVRLALAPRLQQAHAAAIEARTAALAAGDCIFAADYNGPEFAPAPPR